MVGHGERLAKAIARLSNVDFIKVRPRYLKREPAKEGHGITKEDIEIPDNLGSLTVVVADDVIRSGNSMSITALVARDRGARNVLALAAAKTLRN